MVINRLVIQTLPVCRIEPPYAVVHADERTHSTAEPCCAGRGAQGRSRADGSHALALECHMQEARGGSTKQGKESVLCGCRAPKRRACTMEVACRAVDPAGVETSPEPGLMHASIQGESSPWRTPCPGRNHQYMGWTFIHALVCQNGPARSSPHIYICRL